MLLGRPENDPGGMILEGDDCGRVNAAAETAALCVQIIQRQSTVSLASMPRGVRPVSFMGIDHIEYAPPKQHGSLIAKFPRMIDALHHDLDCFAPMSIKKLMGSDLDFSLIHGAIVGSKATGLQSRFDGIP